ncbi:MAG: helix-turn-helix domain-containing protein [Caldilineaceae bacterium SB0665_bin_21]|nr:helix-turn-helix domain-containing protein [Caldilineaceae bacterium SB0665_bin_21]MYA04894.1 helix-turn-helix domain-containing protein [Caldilineaceae bacterium SB0664_bin_22]MYC63879.1 helix-turn-helix domain-containing protein [Caldilineaceae bacterium SB0661_bin_34]
MNGKKVFVSYDHEGDMLEVLWAAREGYFTPTDDERILKRLDDDGEVIGFLIHEMSTLKEPSPIEFELDSEAPADDVDNITVREAAMRLGISERRVRQLARDGRVRGATKAGAEWLIPTPVDVVPGKRGPVGVAGRVPATADERS